MEGGRVYLCEEGTNIVGNTEIGVDTVIYPRTSLGGGVRLGERCLVEERCVIIESSIGHSNTISCGSSIRNTTIGAFNSIGPQCRISDSQIGNLCSIGAGVILEKAILCDNTSVYLVAGRDGGDAGRTNWASTVLPPELLKTKFQQSDALRKAVTNPQNSCFVGKHYSLRA